MLQPQQCPVHERRPSGAGLSPAPSSADHVAENSVSGCAIAKASPNLLDADITRGMMILEVKEGKPAA
jgi:hypothetical protein